MAPTTRVARVPAVAVAAREFGADAGVWSDPWFGQVTLCPAGTGIAFAAVKSPALRGQVMRSAGRPWVQWQGLGEDAEAWLEFSGEGAQRILRMRAIDPDGEWYSLGQIGQYITQANPDFDTRTYGSAKLSDLVRKISSRFEVKPGPGGQLLARDLS